jgi:long-chain acyl-CoA synthetase
VAELVGPRTGFKPFERVYKFKLISKPFEIGTELTPKMELMRPQITHIYAKEIGNLFKNR